MWLPLLAERSPNNLSTNGSSPIRTLRYAATVRYRILIPEGAGPCKVNRPNTEEDPPPPDVDTPDQHDLTTSRWGQIRTAQWGRMGLSFSGRSSGTLVKRS